MAMMGSAARPGSWRILVEPQQNGGKKDRTEAEGLSEIAAVTLNISTSMDPARLPAALRGRDQEHGGAGTFGRLAKQESSEEWL